MSHLDLNGFQRYASKQKEWALDRYASLYDANWTKTAKAGAVTCWPVGGSRLEPSVDFMFAETPPASGDKGPDNPSTITGVSEVKVMRCEKNLAELNRVYALPGRGITVAVNANGSVHVEGAAGDSPPLIDFGNHDDSANKQLPYWMEVGKTYTISFNSSNVNGNPRASLYLSNSLTAWGTEHIVYPEESYTFTVDNTRKRALIRIIFNRNSTINCDCYLQIEEGSSATSFDGTIPDVYTLPLGSTYYGGTLDVATGVLTVTWISEVVVTGTINVLVGVNTNVVVFQYYSEKGHEGNIAYISSALASDKFVPLRDAEEEEHCRFGGSTGISNRAIRFYLNKNRLDVSGAADPSNPTEAEWLSAINAWLADNPITVCYKLFTPVTVQLSPTQILALDQTDKYTPRLNTIYSDQQSVQVGYSKSPIRDEYEKRQAIIASGGE